MKLCRLLPFLPLFCLVPACSQEAPVADPHAGHDMSAMAAPAEGTAVPSCHDTAGMPPPGYAEVAIAPDRQQLIGLKTGRVERATLTATIRAPAVIAADEARRVNVHPRLMGWVRELHVNATGQRVERGDALYSLYSQELFAAQKEYLHARETMPELAAAARSRLHLWGVPDDQIAKMEASGPLEAVVFRSPIRGTVIAKDVVEGRYVEPDMRLYEIADLSRVWILADVYEHEAGRLAARGASAVTIEGLPAPVPATVDYVDPVVDAETRTVRVRLLAANPDGRLRPGSFAMAELPAQSVEGLWVPESAVVDTGTRRVVYRVASGARFQPIVVHTGNRIAGRVEITEGLDEGAEVVTSALFLLDSESQLRGAGAAAPGHGGH